ncbi:alpha/beta fold hydrolase [Roseivirga misakiensis]|uniref:AB hydrolase-1 domain-containing protein n=1 Tax=Roseivirga misakiensis TaxID=1563681 RepID=A0A1E5T398_9BACT|nr:alpha/beta hydrolase [Roseivirga misakiensis]OEK05850.1 hypothetical protein BFP71_06955 [Roseivirga misakiensis]
MKEPLILLHGAIGGITTLEGLKNAMELHFDIYSFNFSGHGKAEFSSKGFGIEVFADELSEFIRENNLIKPKIFGYSMGGYVALFLASTQPSLIGKIATLGTKFNWNPQSAALESSRLEPEVMKEKIPAYTDYLIKTHGYKWDELVIKTAQMMVELGDFPLLSSAQLEKIECDVRIMRGDQDTMVAAEESQNAARGISAASYFELPNTKHPIEKVDGSLLAKELLSFF